MKLLKILVALLAICMLGSALIACDGGEQETESVSVSETEPSKTITVTLQIKAPTGSKDNIEQEVTYSPEKYTLGEVIEFYCQVVNTEPGDDTPFNGLNMLEKIETWKPGEDEAWIAYLNGEGGGRDNPLNSIYEQPVQDGETYVLYIGTP